jgi:hypothetical protein
VHNVWFAKLKNKRVLTRLKYVVCLIVFVVLCPEKFFASRKKLLKRAKRTEAAASPHKGLAVKAEQSEADASSIGSRRSKFHEVYGGG